MVFRLINKQIKEKNMDTINKSTEYDKFKFLVSNREQTRGHVEKLKQAFEEFGNLTKVSPILVNEKMEIVDGQHRYTVCKELEEPVYYTIAPGLGIREARQMNILHNGWKADDFARSYALSGDKNYQKYLQLKEDYGFVHSVMLAYVFGTDLKGMFAQFRNGELKIEDTTEIRERLDKLDELSTLVHLVATKPYAFAILGFMKIEGYDHDRMVRKIAAFADNLKRFQNTSDAQRELEEIYNYKMSDRNRLRLY